MQTALLKPISIGALALLLAGCAAPSGVSQLASRAHAIIPNNPPLAAPAGNASPANQTTDDAALKAVIQKANTEQQQAFAQHDPSVMRDTATDSYYQQMVQTNSDLSNVGVAAIKLMKLQWGQISVNGSQAQANTSETWQTTYGDGTTDTETDPNVYTLVPQNGSWVISDDQQPDSQLQQPAPATRTAPAPGAQPGPVSVPASSGHSQNWSGYEATGGTYTAVSGTWTVPQVDGASAAGADATWVGIGGVQSRDLIQAGTEATATGSGRVRYDAWVETLPQVSHPVPLPVSPGDSVSVSISEQSPGQWLVNLKDSTSGQSYQVTEQYNSSHSSAEWIEEAPSGGRQQVPLDNFGTVSFSDASAVKNGQTVTPAQASAQPITMIDFSRQPAATPSALGSDGKTFSVSRTGSISPTQAIPGGRFVVIPGATGRGRSPFRVRPGLGL